MPNVEITIKTKAELDALKKSGQELENVTQKTKQAGEATDQLTGKKRKLLDGLKALGQEFPVLATLINAAKNPFVLLGVVAVAAIAKIREGIARAKEEQRAYNAVVEDVRVGIETYSDLKRAVDAAAESQKALADQTKGANEFLKQQIELKGQIVQGEVDILSAEEERQAALIERDTNDPVERARKLKENKLGFGARKIALRSALGKEQVAAIDQQIIGEQELQIEAGAGVPNEAGLRAMVSDVATTKSELEQALRENRTAFRKAELARKVIRAGEGELNTEIGGPEFNELQEMGLVYEEYKGQFRYDAAGAQKKLPGLTAASEAAKDRVGRLRGSLRAGLGSLPAGVATEGDIGPFMSTSESKAAETQNASYQRMQNLMRMREKAEFDRANQAAVGGIQNQTAGIRGDIAIGGAQGGDLLGVAKDIQRINGSNNAELARLLKQILADGKITEKEIRDLHKRADRLQNDMQ